MDKKKAFFALVKTNRTKYEAYHSQHTLNSSYKGFAELKIEDKLCSEYAEQDIELYCHCQLFKLTLQKVQNHGHKHKHKHQTGNFISHQYLIKTIHTTSVNFRQSLPTQIEKYINFNKNINSLPKIEHMLFHLLVYALID